MLRKMAVLVLLAAFVVVLTTPIFGCQHLRTTKTTYVKPVKLVKLVKLFTATGRDETAALDALEQQIQEWLKSLKNEKTKIVITGLGFSDHVISDSGEVTVKMAFYYYFTEIK